MLIEPATIEDAEAILALQKLAYQSEAALYGDYRIPPLTQTLQQMQADLRVQTAMKATLDGRIIGSVRAIAKDGTCHIGRLIVHPDFQNQGLGTRLLDEIERRFSQARRYELFTGDRSQRSLHLYQKRGYRVFRRDVLSEKVTLLYLEKPGCTEEQHTPPARQRIG